MSNQACRDMSAQVGIQAMTITVCMSVDSSSQEETADSSSWAHHNHHRLTSVGTCAALPEAAYVRETAPVWQQPFALPGADADRSLTPAAAPHRISTNALSHIAACHGSLAFCDVLL